LSIPAGGRALPLPASVTNTPEAAPATPVAHRERVRRYRHPVYGPQVYRAVPRAAPECPGLYSWNPANPDRGFCDPGFAYHGNVNGCAIDEGYGRWSPCDHMK
jgi:hypothetical protein